MMKKLLFLLSSTCFTLSLWAQQVPVSSTNHDQLVQGPCYIFATVAALESKAIQAGYPNSTDFYEWNLYSEDVLGSKTGNGDTMLGAVLDQASTQGMYSRGSLPTPNGTRQLPNMNDPLVPGIAYFTNSNCSADLTTSAYRYNAFEGTCEDNGSPKKKFEIQSLSGANYTYNRSGTGFVEDTTPSAFEIKNHLNQGRGIIAFFDTWTVNGVTNAHAVFIYGHSGSQYYVKDSYPGNTSQGLRSLNISDMSSYFYLTGSFSPPPSACTKSISGNSSVSSQTTYSLSGSGTASNVQWSVSSNLTVISSNSSSVTVRPSNSTCSTQSGSVSVTYTSSGTSCSDSKSVTVVGGSKTPSSITVLSPNWNYNGETCPNTMLELEAFDGQNYYGATTYNWSIAGATLNSGQGTTTAFVTTSSYQGTTYLTFKVRAKFGNCAYSGWRTITGTSSGSNCPGGGGGALRAYASDDEVVLVENEGLPGSLQQFSYQIVSLEGRLLDEGQVLRTNPVLSLNGIQQRFLILRLFDEHGDYYQQLQVVRP